MSPAQKVAAVLGAAALAIPLIATFEGSIKTGYRDPIGVPTSCVGHTGPDAIVGRVYTDDECTAQLANDAVKHGLDITRCLPDNLPTETRAAFTSAAFNLGSRTFCASSMSRKALAGDLPGACAALSLYVYAGGVKMRGLERRREAEKALCLKGLKP